MLKKQNLLYNVQILFVCEFNSAYLQTKDMMALFREHFEHPLYECCQADCRIITNMPENATEKCKNKYLHIYLKRKIKATFCIIIFLYMSTFSKT